MGLIRTFNVILISGVVFAAAAFAAFTYVAFSVPNPVLQDFSIVHAEETDSERAYAEVEVFNRGGSGDIVVELQALDELDREVDTWNEEVEMSQLERRTLDFNVSEPDNAENFVVDAWPGERPEESLAEPLTESDL